jgi:hypothetical protein
MQLAHADEDVAAGAAEAVPAGQNAQPPAPAFDWKFPAAQTPQPVEPVAAWNVPEAQAVQLDDPVLA